VVEREWLAERLEAGASIEAIAREVDRHPSSVAYWVHKHGLSSSHAERHAARGPLDRGLLTEIVACGLSIREIAEVFARSPASVRHWLRKHGLETARGSRLRVSRTASPADAGPDLRMCPDHGLTPFVLDRGGYQRCRKCRVDAVVRRRAHVRSILIAEAGGACAICGFDGHAAALQFHHVDPAEKSFTIRNGDTRSLERMRREASKCVLLCANCHAQVEAGTADVPVRSEGRGLSP
jgi:5-methylcytosine-specific restriction endonuclease McrA